MTHLWPEGELIGVVSDAWGVPHSFTWRGRTHQVRRITKRWRVDVDWWQDRVWREYFKLATHTGLLVVVYRDVLAGGWYLQRLYD